MKEEMDQYIDNIKNYNTHLCVQVSFVLSRSRIYVMTPNWVYRKSCVPDCQLCCDSLAVTIMALPETNNDIQFRELKNLLVK